MDSLSSGCYDSFGGMFYDETEASFNFSIDSIGYYSNANPPYLTLTMSPCSDIYGSDTYFCEYLSSYTWKLPSSYMVSGSSGAYVTGCTLYEVESKYSGYMYNYKLSVTFNYK